MSYTIILVIINVVVSLAAMNNQDLLNKLIFHPPFVNERREYYRFITCGFIHADFGHLAFNMITLYFFGQPIEDIFVMLGLGKIMFLLFYFSALVVSELPTYFRHKNNDNYFSLGASGAVSAVVFALVLFAPWDKIYFKLFIPIPFILYAVGYLAYSVYMNKKGGDNINHSAHLWGALYGILFMIVVKPQVISFFLEQLTHPQF